MTKSFRHLLITAKSSTGIGFQIPRHLPFLRQYPVPADSPQYRRKCHPSPAQPDSSSELRIYPKCFLRREARAVRASWDSWVLAYSDSALPMGSIDGGRVDQIFIGFHSRHTITFLHSFCKSEKISHIGLQYSCNSFGIDWKPFI